MIDQLLFTITVGIAVLSGGYATLVILLAQYHDLGIARQLRQLTAHPYRRQYRRRPMVSVMVITHNNSSEITDRLTAIYKSSYRKLEVIVVDMASSDKTLQVIKQYQMSQRRRSLHIYTARSHSSTLNVQQRAFKKYGRGELVITVSARQEMAESTIANAVQHFNLVADNAGCYYFGEYVAGNDTLIGLFQKYETILRGQQLKALGPIADNWRPDAARLQTRQTLLAQSAIASVDRRTSYYMSKAVVKTLPERHIDQLLARRVSVPGVFTGLINNFYAARRRLVLAAHLARAVAWISAAVTIGYLVFVAFQLHQPAYLGLVGAAFTSYLLFATWSESQLSGLEKLRASLLIPVSFSYFIMATAAQLLDIIIRGTVAWKRPI